MMTRAFVVLLLCLFSTGARADKPELVTAISLDIPPYVMDKGTKGFEVDLARLCLADYALHLVPMSFNEEETAIQRGVAVAALGVRHIFDTVYYSKVFWAVANYAITKKADKLKLKSVADLRGHEVLAWRQAYLELGKAFERMYTPGSPDRMDYKIFSPQRAQVEAFWRGDGDVIVIDLPLFRYLSKEMGHSMSEVDLHDIFPPATGFRAGFENAELRDTFNRGLDQLCRNGEYDRLLARYDLGQRQSSCEK